MSSLSDRMKQLDEQREKIIAQAVKKKQEELTSNGSTPTQEPPIQDVFEMEEPKKRNNFSLALFSLFLMVFIMTAFIFYFSMRTIEKVANLKNSSDQLAVLLDERNEEMRELRAHVEQMEADFRTRFKENRVSLDETKEELLTKDTELYTKFDEASERIRNDLLSYKTAVTDNEAKMTQLDRDYDDLIKRFNNLQQELKTLRTKVLEATIPSE